MGVPVDVGSGSNTTVGTQQTITTTAQVPAGAKLLVFAGCTVSGNTISSVSDNSGLGNSYTTDVAGSGAGNSAIALVRCDAASSIPSGTVITITWTNSVPAGSAGGKQADVFYITGCATGAPNKSLTGAGSANSTFTSGATGAVTADCQAVGGAFDNGAADAVSGTSTASGSNTRLTFLSGTTFGFDLMTVYYASTVTNGSTATAQGSFTVTGGDDWKALVACYALSPATGASVRSVRIPNRRVGPMALRQRFRQPQILSNPATGQTQVLGTITVNGAATVTATVVKTAVLAATANGSSTVTATVVKTAVLAPAVSGKATVTATVVKTAVLRPSVAGSSTVTAAVVKTAVLKPTVNGVATVTAAVVKTAVLVITIHGSSTVTDAVVATKVIAATVNGVATVTATVSNTNAPAATGAQNPPYTISIYYHR